MSSKHVSPRSNLQRFLLFFRPGKKLESVPKATLERWRHKVFIQGTVSLEQDTDDAGRRLFLVTKDGTRFRIESTHVGRYLRDHVGFEVVVRGRVDLDERGRLNIRPMSFQEVEAEAGPPQASPLS